MWFVFSKSKTLTGRLSEADGEAVKARWEEEKKNIKRPERAACEHTRSAALAHKCCFSCSFSSPDLLSSDLIGSNVLSPPLTVLICL